MTDEQIKKIAEEYAYRNNSNPNPPYCPEEELTKRLTEAFMAGVQYITDSYCVVERSKVVETHRQNNYFAEHPSNPSDSYYQGVIDTLTVLFGSETFNKKEDD